MEKLKTLQQIQFELKQWTIMNFGNQPRIHPIFGMMEEIGELSHAHLKQQQNIRNKDYLAAKKDAVADTVIYMLNYYNIFNIDIPTTITDSVFKTFSNTSDMYLCRAFLQIGKLAKYNNTTKIGKSTPSNLYCNYIFQALKAYSIKEGFDILTVVNDVWEEVSKRNWKKYPTNGLTE